MFNVPIKMCISIFVVNLRTVSKFDVLLYKALSKMVLVLFKVKKAPSSIFKNNESLGISFCSYSESLILVVVVMIMVSLEWIIQKKKWGQ